MLTFIYFFLKTSYIALQVSGMSLLNDGAEIPVENFKSSNDRPVARYLSVVANLSSALILSRILVFCLEIIGETNSNKTPKDSASILK